MDVDGSTEKIAEKVTQLEKLANGVLDLRITPHAIAHGNELVSLDKDLEKVKASLSAQSKTAKLWIQFLEYINVIKDISALRGWVGEPTSRCEQVPQPLCSDRAYTLC